MGRSALFTEYCRRGAIPMFDVIYGQASEPGRVWPRNSDSAAAFIPRSNDEAQSRGWMFAVADGRGGTELGDVASARAIEMVVRGFTRAGRREPLASLMPELIQRANTGLHKHDLIPDQRERRLATTMICCALRDESAVLSHVGDSRCYLVRGDTATLLTQDHTWVTEQRKSGAITAVQAEHSEKRHVLTRVLGVEPLVTPETSSFALSSGDVLVLCTDGLYEAMYPEDIARMVSQDKAPADIARELVSYAVQADGSDNATAQVIRVQTLA